MATTMRVVLAVAVVLLVAVAVADGAGAQPAGRRPVSARVKTQRQVCESGGGTMTSEVYMTIAYTSCSGGTYDGYECTLTASSQDCAYTRGRPDPFGPIDGAVDNLVGVADEAGPERTPIVPNTVGVADELVHAETPVATTAADVADEAAAAEAPIVPDTASAADDE